MLIDTVSYCIDAFSIKFETNVIDAEASVEVSSNFHNAVSDASE